jgi:hypothetical protein
MIVYHVTDAAEAILREGFRDAAGSYMLIEIVLEGVFVSDTPLSINEGCKGEQVLEVDLGDVISLDQYELVEELKPYREWCVPAEILNRAPVRLLSEAEVDALGDEDLP